MVTLKEIFASDNMTPELYRSNQYLNQGANYLAISDVTMVLNQLFDGNWDFEITKSWREEYPAYNKEKLYDPKTQIKSTLPKEELLKRLEGKAKKVLLLERGIYIIFNDKADISYEEFVEMNETFKPLLGLI